MTEGGGCGALGDSGCENGGVTGVGSVSGWKEEETTWEGGEEAEVTWSERV